MTLRKKAKQAPAKRGRKSAKSGFSIKALEKIIHAQAAEIERLLEEMQEQEEMEVSDLLQLQLMINMLSQMTEMYASVISAMNQTIAAMARNIK